jgi:hypothetical protein
VHDRIGIVELAHGWPRPVRVATSVRCSSIPASATSCCESVTRRIEAERHADGRVGGCPTYRDAVDLIARFGQVSIDRSKPSLDGSRVGDDAGLEAW